MPVDVRAGNDNFLKLALFLPSAYIMLRPIF